jgi:hypothetical protein
MLFQTAIPREYLALQVGYVAGYLTNILWLVRVKYGINPIIRTLVIRIANYPDPLGHSGNFAENSTKLICLEITGYWSDISVTSSSKSVSETSSYCNCTAPFL